MVGVWDCRTVTLQNEWHSLTPAHVRMRYDDKLLRRRGTTNHKRAWIVLNILETLNFAENRKKKTNEKSVPREWKAETSYHLLSVIWRFATRCTAVWSLIVRASRVKSRRKKNIKFIMSHKMFMVCQKWVAVPRRSVTYYICDWDKPAAYPLAHQAPQRTPHHRSRWNIGRYSFSARYLLCLHHCCAKHSHRTHTSRAIHRLLFG